MIWFNELVDELNADVQAPEPIRAAMLRRAARDLCTQAPVWIEQVTLELEPGRTEYDLPKATDGTPWIVRWVDGLATQHWQAYRSDKIRFLRDPGQRTLTLHIQYRPEIGGDSIPAHVGETWLDALRYRALYHLLRLPEYRDFQLSEDYKQQFLGEVGRANVAYANQYNTTNSQTATPLIPFV